MNKCIVVPGEDCPTMWECGCDECLDLQEQWHEQLEWGEYDDLLAIDDERECWGDS